MKAIKKVLLIALVYLLGIGYLFVLSSRAQQIDNHNETKNVSSIAHK